MATTVSTSLASFDLGAALNGASIAFSSSGTSGGTVNSYVIDFKLNDISSVSEKYSGVSVKDRKIYFFDEYGNCSNGSSYYKLFIVNTTITACKDGDGTRGDTDDNNTEDIKDLAPREYFAMYALQGILSNIDSPLAMDDKKITYISELAFKIAQSMMKSASNYRAKTKADEPPTPEGGESSGDNNETT